MVGFASDEIWEPTPKQDLFLGLPDSIFEGLFGGAVGGGKSDCLLILPLARGFDKHPQFKGLILRRTIKELEKELIPRSERYYRAAGGVYNEQKKIWRFPSGARIYFGHAEHEKDIKNYDGVEWNYVGWDEVTKFTLWMYLYLVGTRIRSGYVGGPAISRASGMPGDIGNGWVRNRFIEPEPEGGKIIQQLLGYDEQGKPKYAKRIFIKSMPYDNPHLLKNTPDYLDRLALLSEAERRAKLGDWWSFEGQVFDNFRIEPLPDEPSNARHVIEPFEIPDYWPKVNLTDWGFRANTVSLWAAIAPDGRVYIYREYCVSQTGVDVWATEIGDFNRRDKNLRVVGIDTNAWDERGEPETIAQQFERFSRLRELGLSLQAASKSRISGKILVQEYLRWKGKPPSVSPEMFDENIARLIMERRGPEAYEEYLSKFQPEPSETNLPKLQIFNTCTELIRVLPLCVYDEKNKEDVKEFDGDDAYDCLRYTLKAVTRYLDESKTEHQKLVELAKVEERLKTSRDFTSYAIARAHLEGQHKGFSVPRYSRNLSRNTRVQKLQNARIGFNH